MPNGHPVNKLDTYDNFDDLADVVANDVCHDDADDIYYSDGCWGWRFRLQVKIEIAQLGLA